MPRLILFAPCQKVISDKFDGSLSMIGIIDGFTLFVEESASIPEEAATKISWVAVSVWNRQDGDEGKTFEQRMDIVKPNGDRPRTDKGTEFRMTEHSHEVVLFASAFPAGMASEYKLILSVHEVGTDDWRDVAEYPIYATHQRQETANEQAQPNLG